MKAFVVGGAGTLGSTSAFLLAKEGICQEVVLCDVFGDKAKNHAMDMEQALWASSCAKVRWGELSDMDGADLVIAAFSVPSCKPGLWTYEDAVATLPVLTELSTALRERAPKAVVITMTNPVDVLNYVLHKLSGLPGKQFIGYSFNDSLRMRWAISRRMSLMPQDIRCVCMGEHGPSKVPVYSCVQVNGRRCELSAQERQKIEAMQRDFWAEYFPLGKLRTAGWTSAMGILELAEHLTGRRQGYIGCSCVLEGEYGLSGLSAGVPAYLNMGGVEHVEELPLEAAERAAFQRSADGICSMISRTFPML